MPDLSSLFPAILATHITLAICLLVPSLLLPFTLRNRLRRPERRAGAPGRVVRGLSWAQANGTMVIGIGLALTGIAMIAVLGPRMLQQPWLLVSLATYAIAAVIAFVDPAPEPCARSSRGTASRPTPTAPRGETAHGGSGTSRTDSRSAVGLIGFLMSTKPQLW